MRTQQLKPFTSSGGSRGLRSLTQPASIVVIPRICARNAPPRPTYAAAAAATNAGAVGQPSGSNSSSSNGRPANGPVKQQWAPPTAILKINPELLKAGGLDPVAEGPAAQASFAAHLDSLFVPVNLEHPGLRVLNIDPPVLVVRDFLTAEQCDAIVQAATDSGLMRRSEVGAVLPPGYPTSAPSPSSPFPSSPSTGPSPSSSSSSAATPAPPPPPAGDLSQVRTSSTLAATSEVLSQQPQLDSALAPMLAAARGLLRGPLPPEGTAAFNRPVQPGQMAFELPQVARYQQGQHFLAHEDAFPLDLAASKGFQRRATLLTYLNDCEQGGATHFDVLGISVRPVKGSALLFFPSFSNGVPDGRTLHTAQDAVTDKWVTQLWLSCGLRTAGSSRAQQQQQQPAVLRGSREYNNKKRNAGGATGRKRGVPPQRINTKI